MSEEVESEMIFKENEPRNTELGLSQSKYIHADAERVYF